MVKKGNTITEEDEIVFCHENDLSYGDTGKKFVALYVLDDFVGNTKVYWDNDQEDREYIVINQAVHYLDVLKLRK